MKKKLIKIRNGDVFTDNCGPDDIRMYRCINEKKVLTIKHSKYQITADNDIRRKLKENPKYCTYNRVEKLWYTVRGFEIVN